MTVTLKLAPDELAVLQRYATAAGVEIEDVLHSLIAQLPALKMQGMQTGHQQEEDPEEQQERERERVEIEANILRWQQERSQAPPN